MREMERLLASVFRENLKHDYAIWHFIRYKKMADFIGDMDGKYVLDIGCGIGFLDLIILNKKIVGIDTNPGDIREAERVKKMINPEENTLCFVVADLHFLPFKEKFDVIVCSEVLEHLTQDRVALKAMLPTLKEGGFLLITLPNALRFEFPQLFKLRRKIRKYPGHVKEYQIGDLPNLLRTLPLKIEKITGIYLDFPIFHIFSFPLSYIFNIPIYLFRSSGFSIKYRFFVLKALYQIYARLWVALERVYDHYTYYITIILKKSTGTMKNETVLDI